ncbi:hypothetical protein [Flavobacterium johnsoniae]|uniref:Uncharacterized protein n=1 Tax=Flavobacterium johnsoniae (strain ATCC 17061 / DSM 2064 / JCM 8514 / BCRC 14874 / CCUG 350202 / NBRC 14942 / NCIMB 11054 / UW101) TaxID=376686 RepID=A5FEU8_FLAJ1|nr:hypothetical protein [Flavobacterium johnsoniae]ABQ06273.1 hypothetical protein Fjoh_3257 [Flavobacterium johnsoniae UW101]OXE98257.1 hypothetical protein B0A63_15010 [Flavobacterium johnsoniae UW101]WQG82021.1 hypothetical protein SR927_02710 [Flavobacterium johnsoniae UW101]SHK70566.1 hypothetical protein SAMN05444146_1996 [Flavobacterium johnsoniae]
MSRIRLVRGTITKTTGGDHNIYSEGNIVYNSGQAVTETSDTGIKYGDPKDIPQRKNDDFDITFELDKKTKSVVPLGILDFKNNAENPYFCFKFGLKKTSIDSLNFQIIGENDEIIYQMTYLQTIIVKASELPKIFSNIPKSTQEPILSKIWDFQKIYNEFASSPGDYTKEGEYVIHWDGFDNNDVYDSTKFNNKKLKARITATKGDKQKSLTIDFSTNYTQVQWTDVKIDRSKKRIDITLRVDLRDGGTKGLNCYTYNLPEESSYETFTPTTGTDPLKGYKTTICDWDKIPASELNPAQPVLKTRTKSFEELKKLAFEGLERYWGRNKNNIVGNNVNIIDSYEVFIKPIDTTKNALNSLPLVYNTNGGWMRSGNPGASYDDGNLDDDLLNALPDLGVIQRLSYNAGYIKHDWKNDAHNGWRYHIEKDSNTYYDEVSNFKETAAHELGHEFLQAYAGTAFSWQHKGSSYYLPQDTKPIKGDETFWGKMTHMDEMPETSGEYYPKNGEIDLMKYYNTTDKAGKFVAGADLKRTIAAEKDVLGLIWLTKLKIQ